MVNVPTSLNNFKTKVDDLDVAKLKSISIDLRKLYGLVSKEVVKTSKYKIKHKIQKDIIKKKTNLLQLILST